ncbi:MAG: membrane protein insertion efficiency factor YidD [Candidatus Omnitrophica bacterium]|nr:membrane protein insertion efficiency factor YidD [Candidatus Omnitrophota bacterium]MDD5552471.1 membrane protein insertion efficiency factor YidD [Candidatus Omnitrophota bacterium]
MLARSACKLIEIYQTYIRIALPHSCRFAPTCSEYTKEAISRYGFFRGTFKGVRRLLRCQPFSRKFGYDPVN